MSTIKNLYQEALLAEATYADFSDQIKSPLQALKDEGMSNTQAADFLTHWEVVSHQANTPNGFSATVFRRKDADLSGTYEVGEYVFAVRGSETFSITPPEVDWFSADFGEIGGYGIAINQALDMYNYWQSLTQTGVYQAAKLQISESETTQLSAKWSAAK